MNQPNQMQQKSINVKLDEAAAEGVYANMFVTTFSPAEFIFDFGRMMPGLPHAKILSRVITTPQKAKQLLNILEKNIESFEKQFGEIKVPGEKEDREIGFKSV